MANAETEKTLGEVVISLSLDEIQAIAQEQFGRSLSERELEALDDLSPIGLHDWIGLAIDAANTVPHLDDEQS